MAAQKARVGRKSVEMRCGNVAWAQNQKNWNCACRLGAPDMIHVTLLWNVVAADKIIGTKQSTQNLGTMCEVRVRREDNASVRAGWRLGM